LFNSKATFIAAIYSKELYIRKRLVASLTDGQLKQIHSFQSSSVTDPAFTITLLKFYDRLIGQKQKNRRK
jgi:hypothetical protein